MEGGREKCLTEIGPRGEQAEHEPSVCVCVRVADARVGARCCMCWQTPLACRYQSLFQGFLRRLCFQPSVWR